MPMKKNIGCLFVFLVMITTIGVGLLLKIIIPLPPLFVAYPTTTSLVTQFARYLCILYISFGISFGIWLWMFTHPPLANLLEE